MTVERVPAAGGQWETASSRQETQVVEFVVVNEATILRLLWSGWRGRPNCLVSVMPCLRLLMGPLERMAAWAVRRGLARPIDDASVGLPVHDRYPGDSLFLPLHPDLETKLRALLAVNQPGTVEREYAYVLRKALSDYTQANLLLLGIVTWAEKHWPGDRWKLRGAPPHLRRLYAWHHDRSFVSPNRFQHLGACAINLLNGVLTFASVVLWICARTRQSVPMERYRLAVDRISPIDLHVARTVVDNPAEVLVVERSKAAACMAVDSAPTFRSCTKEDARVPAGTAVRLLAGLARDMWVLYRRFAGVDPGLFGRFAALAGKRAMFAAFFCRFRPAFFWGRDDYSMDHVVRNQELRKIGGRSLGINHGLPINTYISQWREIDFDIYYVYGRHLYGRFYKEAWPPHMLVKPVGNIHLTPERRIKLCQSRSKDIAFFAIVTPRFDFVMEQVIKIARHFGDRSLHLRMKGNRDGYYRERAAFWMAKMPANVKESREAEPYELMASIGYALTPGSTTGAEAMQFGAKTLILDVEPDFRWFYYRNFPGLTVSDAESVIHRIEAIEAGTEVYDFSRYSDLIEMPGPDVYDIIRADIADNEKRPAL